MDTDEQSRLLDSILEILLANGLKATKMDDIANILQISKRTLYEIFNSKTEMIVEAMNHFHIRLLRFNLDYQKRAENVMDSIIMSFVLYRHIIERMNRNFFRDFHMYYSDVKHLCDKSENDYMDNFISLLHRAEAEGYIRNDINYLLQFRVAQLQLNFINRLEELFPPDITLLQVYDTTSVGFLRAIASPKGLTAIDARLHKFEAATSGFDIPADLERFRIVTKK